MKGATFWDGKKLTPREEITVDEKTGKRWVAAGIAETVDADESGADESGNESHEEPGEPEKKSKDKG